METIVDNGKTKKDKQVFIYETARKLTNITEGFRRLIIEKNDTEIYLNKICKLENPKLIEITKKIKETLDEYVEANFGFKSKIPKNIYELCDFFHTNLNGEIKDLDGILKYLDYINDELLEILIPYISDDVKEEISNKKLEELMSNKEVDIRIREITLLYFQATQIENTIYHKIYKLKEEPDLDIDREYE